MESSVVRIEPKNPVPKVDFVQWDGLLRVCFSRKNKLIVAIFKKKVILNLLFKNHCKAREISQRASTPGEKELLMLGREDAGELNLSKKRKKKQTRQQKMQTIQIEGVKEEKLAALEIENSEDEDGWKDRQGGTGAADEDSKEAITRFKAHLVSVMETNGFAKERASKMHWSRFLELLQVLNANEIYFR